MLENLKGRVAVVTGASEGIGEAIVRRLAAEGMRVAALARRGDKLAELESDMGGNESTVKGYICDVQSETDVRGAFQSIGEDLGPVAVLVNNAGVFRPVSLADINVDDVQALLNTNVVGVLSCTREAIASMKTHSVDRGHIVNINSVAGHREVGGHNLSVYCASKRAITSISNSLRKELKSYKIRVTSISPHLVKTSMTADIMSKMPEDTSHLVPSDVADAVIYALSAPYNVNVAEVILEVA